MSEAPKFAKGPPLRDSETPLDEDSLMGCAPYIQLFKAGKLLFTTAATVSYQQDEQELPFCHIAQGPVSFNIEQVLQGDVLIRCRHLTATGQRVSMFRVAIHTGYVPPKVMRLSKGELDGACNDKRFGQDFFLDLIFEPCDAEMASQHLNTGKAETESAESKEQKRDESETKDDEKKDSESNKSEKGGTIVTASVYDSMLHRDSRFWDVIAERREQHSSTQHEDEEVDPMWGPTIGRKRDLTSKGFAEKTEGKLKDQSSALQTFSIGGDLDFFDSTPPTGTPQQQKSEPKRDELMEALMALDDDLVSPPTSQVQSKYDEVSATPYQDEIEEIVFESASEEPANAATKLEESHATVVELPPLKNENPADVVVEKPAVEDNVISDEVKSESEHSKEQSATETVEPTTTSTVSAVDETTADLLQDADLDMDADLDALLAADDEQDADLPDDLNDLDFDDEDLMDLEKMLSTAKK
jgi:tensin